MFSEAEYFYGHRKYGNKFDKLGELASSLFGPISQCGVIEVNRSGDTFIVASRPDFGEAYAEHKRYLSDEYYIYSDNLNEGVSTFDASHNLTFLYDDKENNKTLDILHGFYYTEKTSNHSFRHYGFASDTQNIYKKLIENYLFIETFIKYFKDETKHILNDVSDHKINMLDAKGESYFKSPFTDKKTTKEKFTELLYNLNLLNKNEQLSDREFQCMRLYCKGNSSKMIGNILNLSHRTIESHVAALKAKLCVSTRHELMEILSY